MDPKALELLRLLQSEVHDAATLAAVRALFPEVHAGLTAAGDASTLEELRGLLEAWAHVAAPVERAEALVLAAGMVEGAERARLLRVVGQLRLEQAGDVDGAIAVYEEALDADAEVALIRELADLYALRAGEGDGERAADLYATLADLAGGAEGVPLLEKALDLAPGHSEALTLLEATVAEAERPAKLRERWETYVAATTDEAGAAERRIALARVDGAAQRYRDALLWIAPLVDRGDPTAQKLKETFLSGLASSAAATQGQAPAATTAAVDRPLPARALSPRSGQTMVGFKVPGGAGGDATLEAIERARRELQAQANAAEAAEAARRAAASKAVAPVAVAPVAAASVAARVAPKGATMLGRDPLAPSASVAPKAAAPAGGDPLAPARGAPAAAKPASPAGHAQVTKPEFAATMMGISPGSLPAPAGRVSGVAATMPAIFPSGRPPASLAPGAPQAAPATPAASWPPVAPRASAPGSNPLAAAPASWPPVAPRASAPAPGSPSRPAPSPTAAQSMDGRASVPLVFPTESGPRPSAVRAPHVDTIDFGVPRRGIPWLGKPVFIGAGVVLVVVILFMIPWGGSDQPAPPAAPVETRTSSVPAATPTPPPPPAPAAEPTPSEPTGAAPTEAAPTAAPPGAPAVATTAKPAPSSATKTSGSAKPTTAPTAEKPGVPSDQPSPEGSPEPTPAVKGAPSADDIVPDLPSTPKSTTSGTRGKASVDLATGPARVKGGKLTVKDVVAALQPKLGALRRCYERALGRNGKLDGRLMLQWPVNAKGRAGTVKKVSGSTLNDAKLVKCESEVVRDAKFSGAASEVRMGFDHTRPKR